MKLQWTDGPTPAVPLVTAEEAVAQSRIPSVVATVEETLIDRLILAATKHAERRTSRAFIERNSAFTAFAFPSCGAIPLYNVSPVSAVFSIEYYDTDNALQTLSTDYYSAQINTDTAQIWLNDSYSWPDTYPRHDAVIITATAGYGSAASDVPADLKHAVIMLTAHYYEHREAVNDTALHDVPMAVDSILSLYDRPDVSLR